MANPIVKWIGGKRQLLSVLSIPDFNTYYEPFFGGGAVFFDIAPKKAVINDMNKSLMYLYETVKENPQKVIKGLENIQDKFNSLEDIDKKSKFYYECRDKYNKYLIENKHSFEEAILFVFLNKACFNGLYRVNKKGLFNAAFNHNKTLNLFDKENILEVSKILKTAEIKTGDFEDALINVQSGDFVFFDPPYYETYTKYSDNMFKDTDQIRLANLYKELTNKGVKCLLTNSDTEFIHNLYSDFKIEVIDVKRLVNRDANNRKGTDIIVTNF